MGLLDMLAGRGGVASLNAAQQQSSGDPMLMRGQMPWQSGFEGTQKMTQTELLRQWKLKQDEQQRLAQHFLPLSVNRTGQTRFLTNPGDPAAG